MTPHQRKIADMVPKLLQWFSESARDLPWRRTRDPYAIWVSEIMLQQTQVKTVIPYWERWMRSLPTIRSLARARPERLHKLWEGLGYYTRVRNLQKAAREIEARHDGVFPRDYDAMLALPGIGRYTAGAIASIAFNQPKPILDGNVIRVLTRFFGITDNPRDKAVNEELWRLSEALVSAAANLKHPASAPATPLPCSHLNQSLMELGALVCTPKSPDCPACPLRRRCVALRKGVVARLPNLGPRAAATSRRFAAFVLERDGRFLVRQRPAGVVNAHLWEFPNVELGRNGEATDFKTAAENILGPGANGLEKFCTIRHTITRYRISLEAFRGTLPAKTPHPDGHWHPLSKLRKLAFPSAHRKILDRL